MFFRKIQKHLERYFTEGSDRVLVLSGARQVGKTYIIRHLGQQQFANYIEINMEEDALGDRLFANVRTKEDFYLALSVAAGERMGTKDDTLVFIDEIQRYDYLLTLLKFLKDDDRFTYIASGSLLGVSLKLTPSIPLGYIEILPVYPLDFEEFLLVNGVGKRVLDTMQKCFAERQSLPDAIHAKMIHLFRMYLLCGGMPAAVQAYADERNIVKVRNVQQQIHSLYQIDASRYEDARGKLKIRRIYEMIPSNMENRKKRIVAKDIEDRPNKRMNSYQDEFDYLIASGIALEVKAVSKPAYPLLQSNGKNLLKLYLNDVGMLTALLFNNNIQPIVENVRSINLGAVYESVVAQELRAHGHPLFYFDSKKMGEVDFLIDDYRTLSVAPIEVKSGRDYAIHSAINNLISVREYNVTTAYVLSNEGTVRKEGAIVYMPIYFAMFL